MSEEQRDPSEGDTREAAELDPAYAAGGADLAELLEHGEVRVLGQLAASSNETFLVAVTLDGDEALAIYKPLLGERPLRDFAPGLYRRERAAYLLSEALDWGVVPLTVTRDDAPFGAGSLQLFVEHDPGDHYFNLVEDESLHDQLRRLAVFDVVANNTDRKAGHVLLDARGRVWGIDHGLCFAAPFKLRTVIWDFAEEPIAEPVLSEVSALIDEVPADVAELLTEQEVSAIKNRARYLLAFGELPNDPAGMRTPWPLV